MEKPGDTSSYRKNRSYYSENFFLFYHELSPFCNPDFYIFDQFNYQLNNYMKKNSLLLLLLILSNLKYIYDKLKKCENCPNSLLLYFHVHDGGFNNLY